MSDQNQWTPEQFRRLRDALRRPGTVTLKLWPELPDLEVTLDLSGYGPLLLSGKLSNAILAAKDRAVQDAAEQMEQHPEDLYTWVEMSNKVLEYHDYILGAVIVKPKYYMLDQLPPGCQPEDGLCVYDFTPEMRWSIINVLNSGMEELAKFRDDPLGYAAALSERTARSAAERVDSAPRDAVVDQGDVRSGDLARGDASRTRKPATRRQESGDEGGDAVAS